MINQNVKTTCNKLIIISGTRGCLIAIMVTLQGTTSAKLGVDVQYRPVPRAVCVLQLAPI